MALSQESVQEMEKMKENNKVPIKNVSEETAEKKSCVKISGCQESQEFVQNKEEIKADFKQTIEKIPKETIHFLGETDEKISEKGIYEFRKHDEGTKKTRENNGEDLHKISTGTSELLQVTRDGNPEQETREDFQEAVEKISNEGELSEEHGYEYQKPVQERQKTQGDTQDPERISSESNPPQDLCELTTDWESVQERQKTQEDYLQAVERTSNVSDPSQELGELSVDRYQELILETGEDIQVAAERILNEAELSQDLGELTDGCQEPINEIEETGVDIQETAERIPEKTLEDTEEAVERVSDEITEHSLGLDEITREECQEINKSKGHTPIIVERIAEGSREDTQECLERISVETRESHQELPAEGTEFCTDVSKIPIKKTSETTKGPQEFLEEVSERTRDLNIFKEGGENTNECNLAAEIIQNSQTSVIQTDPVMSKLLEEIMKLKSKVEKLEAENKKLKVSNPCIDEQITQLSAEEATNHPVLLVEGDNFMTSNRGELQSEQSTEQVVPDSHIVIQDVVHIKEEEEEEEEECVEDVSSSHNVSENTDLLPDPLALDRNADESHECTQDTENITDIIEIKDNLLIKEEHTYSKPVYSTRHLDTVEYCYDEEELWSLTDNSLFANNRKRVQGKSKVRKTANISSRKNSQPHNRSSGIRKRSSTYQSHRTNRSNIAEVQDLGQSSKILQTLQKKHKNRNEMTNLTNRSFLHPRRKGQRISKHMPHENYSDNQFKKKRGKSFKKKYGNAVDDPADDSAVQLSKKRVTQSKSVIQPFKIIGTSSNKRKYFKKVDSTSSNYSLIETNKKRKLSNSVNEECKSKINTFNWNSPEMQPFVVLRELKLPPFVHTVKVGNKSKLEKSIKKFVCLNGEFNYVTPNLENTLQCNKIAKPPANILDIDKKSVLTKNVLPKRKMKIHSSEDRTNTSSTIDMNSESSVQRSILEKSIKKFSCQNGEFNYVTPNQENTLQHNEFAKSPTNILDIDNKSDLTKNVLPKGKRKISSSEDGTNTSNIIDMNSESSAQSSILTESGFPKPHMTYKNVSSHKSLQTPKTKDDSGFDITDKNQYTNKPVIKRNVTTKAMSNIKNATKVPKKLVVIDKDSNVDSISENLNEIIQDTMNNFQLDTSPKTGPIIKRRKINNLIKIAGSNCNSNIQMDIKKIPVISLLNKGCLELNLHDKISPELKSLSLINNQKSVDLEHSITEPNEDNPKVLANPSITSQNSDNNVTDTIIFLDKEPAIKSNHLNKFQEPENKSGPDLSGLTDYIKRVIQKNESKSKKIIFLVSEVNPNNTENGCETNSTEKDHLNAHKKNTTKIVCENDNIKRSNILLKTGLENNKTITQNTNINNGIEPKTSSESVSTVIENIIEKNKALLANVNVKPRRKMFKCIICSYLFCLKNQLIKHMSAKHLPDMKCDLCDGKMFDSPVLYIKHVDSHTRKKFNCEICNKEFGKPFNLKVHLKLHERVEFNCKECEKTFKSKYLYEKHCRKHEDYLCEQCGKMMKCNRSAVHKTVCKGKGEQQLLCTYCGNIFKSLSGFEEHQRRHTKEKPILCSICGEAFHSYKMRRVHERRHNKEAPFKCHICDRRFFRHDGLTCHLRVHEPDPEVKRRYARPRKTKLNAGPHNTILTYTCDVCNLRFAYLRELTKHCLIHSLEEIKTALSKNIEKRMDENSDTACIVCGREYPILSMLKLHMRQHMGGKGYKCRACGKFCYTQAELIAHKKTHHLDNRTLQCNLCGKDFEKKVNLQLHLLVHTGEHKKLKCQYCDKCFSSNEHLNTHIRLHTGERPYKCDICSKSFHSYRNFMGHRIVHTTERPFMCKFCDKGFKKSYSLKMHMRSHTGERPYPCKICGRCFARTGDRNKHEELHSKHPNGIRSSRPKRVQKISTDSVEEVSTCTNSIEKNSMNRVEEVITNSIEAINMYGVNNTETSDTSHIRENCDTEVIDYTAPISQDKGVDINIEETVN